MEWVTNPDLNGINFDIGFQPRMQLLSTAPSTNATIEYLFPPKKFRLYSKPIRQLSNYTYEKIINNIKWQEEVPLEKAIENLEKSLFPFKEVNFFTVLS